MPVVIIMSLELRLASLVITVASGKRGPVTVTDDVTIAVEVDASPLSTSEGDWSSPMQIPVFFERSKLQFWFIPTYATCAEPCWSTVMRGGEL
jgi:hypothetical protein